MSVIGRKDLSLLRTKNYDFITRVDTPYQLLNLKAFVHSKLCCNRNGDGRKGGLVSEEVPIKSKGIIIWGLLLVGRHPQNDYILDKDSISFGPGVIHDAYYYDEEQKPHLNDQDIKNIPDGDYHKPLYIVHPDRPWSYFSMECKYSRKRVYTVVVDDGLGTYYGSLQWGITTAYDTGKIYDGVKYFVGRVVGNVLIRLKGVKVIYFSFFGKKDFGNPEVAKLLKVEMEREARTIDNIIIRPNSVVYISQPFSDKDAYTKTIAIAKKVLKRYINNGFHVYLKLHPREIENGLWNDCDFELLPNYPIEEIIINSNIKPMFLVGWHSTALITVSFFGDIKAVSLCNLYKDHSRALGYFEKLLKEQSAKLPNIILYEED